MDFDGLFLNLLKYLREFVWLQGGRNVSITVYDRWKLEVAVAVAELHHGFDGLTNGRLVVTSGMKPLRTICLYFPMPHRSTKTEARNS